MHSHEVDDGLRGIAPSGPFRSFRHVLKATGLLNQFVHFGAKACTIKFAIDHHDCSTGINEGPGIRGLMIAGSPGQRNKNSRDADRCEFGDRTRS